MKRTKFFFVLVFFFFFFFVSHKAAHAATIVSATGSGPLADQAPVNVHYYCDTTSPNYFLIVAISGNDGWSYSYSPPPPGGESLPGSTVSEQGVVQDTNSVAAQNSGAASITYTLQCQYWNFAGDSSGAIWESANTTFMFKQAPTPTPCACPSVSPTPTPSPGPSGSVPAATPLGWIQISGRAHSAFNGSVPATQYDMTFILPPSAVVYNAAVNAITSITNQIIGVTGVPIGVPAPGITITSYTALAPTSYANLEALALNQIYDPTLTSPSLSAPAQDKLFLYNGDLTAGGWTINGISGLHPSDANHVVVFVRGNLWINQNMAVDPGGFLAFIVNGNINIDKAVTNVDGIYYAQGKICTSCDNTSTPVHF